MNGICKTALATLILIGAPAFAGFAGTNSAASGLPAKKMESRQIMRPGYDRFTGMVNAVIIDEGPLVHSAQILPWGRQGEIIGKGDASRQAEQVLENLLLALNAAHVLEGGVVKINFYITRPDTIARMKEAMAHQPNNFNRVAASFVTGNLTDPDALVAADAVAVASFDTDNHAVNRVRAPGLPFMKDTAAAILPGGGKYYVSGQAKEGASLLEAAQNTLASLETTLTFLGLSKTNVVQLKAFMQPISAAGSVQKEIAKFFAPDIPPPVVFVEANNPTNLPIEIELVAADNKPPVMTGESVDFLTPPELTASKVFSRVAHVNHGRVAYFSGLYGNAPGTAAAQLNDIYIYFDYLAQKTHTDFDHLVKATYYLTDDGGSTSLNDIRSKFYSPQKPPAASKAVVTGVGFPDRTVTLDMIAVVK